MRTLVRLFLADYPKLLRRLRRAIGAGDASALRTAAHALKGAVSNFAAPAATEAALRLQRMGEAGTLVDAPAACVSLERELGAVRRALSALVATRRPRPARRRAPPRLSLAQSRYFTKTTSLCASL